MSFDNPLNHPQSFSSPVQFQIPSFVCSSAPTLAPGGGAEVLPISLLSDNQLAHTWFSNSGFTPRLFTDQYPPGEQGHKELAQQLQQPYPQQRSHNHYQHHRLHQQQQYRNKQQYQSQQQHSQYASAPFDFDSQVPLGNEAPPPSFPGLRTLTQAEVSAFIQPQPSVLQPSPPNAPVTSSLGLPVYSASGFDLLSILARVANRPNPRVDLGPVDLTCSFVVVDVRRYDHPIVYCSPNFCQLTGYLEEEVVGRNCRFLQAPNGQVVRGESRRFTDQTAVAHLRKNLSADKECQTSIINYRKDGTAFMNLVTVIPIFGGVSGARHEESEVVYHVGFQVDLTEQPNVILEKLRNGNYLTDREPRQQQCGGTLAPLPSSSSSPLGAGLHEAIVGGGGGGHMKDRKSALPPIRMSRDLKKLLADPAFIKSIPISSSTTVCSPPQTSSATSSTRAELDSMTSSLLATGANQLLHLILLEASPDFVLVVSLKGKFLYVAPSVRRVLGYEPEELVEQSISDYAHLEDVVPLMRELKEGSATGLGTAHVTTTMSVGDGLGGGGAAEGGNNNNHDPGSILAATVAAAADQSLNHPVGMQMAPRTVDLLFRMRTKIGAYVWIECKGRLHLEPGKGRKAIILSARAKEMPNLDWHLVARDGLSLPATVFDDSERGVREVRTETWGMISGGCRGEAASFVVVGAATSDILGWSCSELTGRQLSGFIAGGSRAVFDEIRILDGTDGVSSPRRVFCKMRHKNGSVVDVVFVLYQPNHDPLLAKSLRGVVRAPLIYQLRLLQPFNSQPLSPSLHHSVTTNVFEPLDTNRDSSWQYELQQIRFANQRLTDEITALERQIQEVEDMRPRVPDMPQHNSHEAPERFVGKTTNHHSYLHPQQIDHQIPVGHHCQKNYIASSEQMSCYQNIPPVHRDLAHYPSMGPYTCSPQPQRAPPAVPVSHGWDTSLYMQHTTQQSLKRSWDIAMNQ